MALRNDQSIVLRVSDYSETSQIVTLFTADSGLVRLIAKGARRGTRQRFASGLDLLERGQACYLPPRSATGLGLLTDWTQHETFPGLRRALLRLHGGLYLAELLTALTVEYDPHPGLFARLREALRSLADGPDPLRAVVRFQLELGRAIGYDPQFERCVACTRPRRRGAAAYFSSAAGGLLCRDCGPNCPEKQRLPPGLLDRGPAASPQPWFELLDYHLRQVAGRDFKTAGPLRALLSARQRPAP